MAIVTIAQIKSFLDISDPCQASGLLTVGQKYEIKSNTTGDFSNVGAADNNVGTSFLATGTTPTDWGDGILYIVDESRDNKILALIPVVEADYRRIRNYPFVICRADTTDGDATLENVTVEDADVISDLTEAIQSVFDNIDRGMLISGTGIQSEITDFDVDEEIIELADDATATGTEILLTVYPAGADYVSSLMIEYNLYKRHGFKSERTGDYSYSQETIVDGYPESISGMIQRFANFI